MSSLGNDILGLLNDFAKWAIDARGAHQLLGTPAPGNIVRGKDENGREFYYSFPVVKVDHRIIDGNPLSIWFDKNYETSKVRMHCEFYSEPYCKLDSNYRAMRLAECQAFLVIDGDHSFSRKVDLSYNKDIPQRFTGTVDMTPQEFVLVKDKFNKSEVHFEFDGELRWYDLSNASVVKMLQEKKEAVKPSTYRWQGKTDRIFISIEDEGNVYYRDVRGLLGWEKEELLKDEERYVVYFRDTMEKDTFYLLPQIYWIKADPKTNLPAMSVTTTPGADPNDKDDRRILLNFTVAPYYHPSAEQDLLTVIHRRSSGKVKYCYISYGGYKSAQFEWAPEFQEGYHDTVGIWKGVRGEVSTSPDTSFNLSLECLLKSIDILIGELTTDGLKVGYVVFPEDKIEGEVLKVPVVLNLLRLSQLFIETQMQLSTDPDVPFPYQALILNRGEIGLDIRGCDMTLLARENGVVKDIRRGLTCANNWPFFLDRKKGMKVQLSRKDIYDLTDSPALLRSRSSVRWTDLDCRPHKIYLRTDDVKSLLLGGTFDKITEGQTDPWILNVMLNLSPELFQRFGQVEIQITPEGGRPESVVLTQTVTYKDVSLPRTYQSVLRGDNRLTYSYQIRVDRGGWSDPNTVVSTTTNARLPSLVIHDSILLPLL